MNREGVQNIVRVRISSLRLLTITLAGGIYPLTGNTENL